MLLPRASGGARATAVLVAVLSIAPGLWAKGPTARPSLLGKGKFLIAGRELGDPNFFHTVVLLLEHSSEGALGVIVNRPTEVKLADLLPDMKGLGGRLDLVFAGGPVLPSQMLILIRSAGEPREAREVMAGVYYSSSRETLAELVAQGGDGADVRVFAGHAGWAAGQLEWEVERGGWHILTAESSSVFDEEPAMLWERLIERTSGVLARLRPPASSPGRAGVPAYP